MDLFDSAGTDDAGLPLDARAPLAVRMRPRSLDEVLEIFKKAGVAIE